LKESSNRLIEHIGVCNEPLALDTSDTSSIVERDCFFLLGIELDNSRLGRSAHDLSRSHDLGCCADSENMGERCKGKCEEKRRKKLMIDFGEA
jgi:hypothetical protein